MTYLGLALATAGAGGATVFVVLAQLARNEPRTQKTMTRDNGRVQAWLALGCGMLCIAGLTILMWWR